MTGGIAPAMAVAATERRRAADRRMFLAGLGEVVMRYIYNIYIYIQSRFSSRISRISTTYRPAWFSRSDVSDNNNVDGKSDASISTCVCAAKNMHIYSRTPYIYNPYVPLRYLGPRVLIIDGACRK